jgi:membrane-associated phospholipid phosphatase
MFDILHNIDWVLPLRTPELTKLAFALSWLGYPTFIMFFVVLGYWSWNKSLFFRMLLLAAFSAVLNGYLKDLIQDPRPPLAQRLDDLVGDSYGFPSGHAQMAVVIWLWLAYALRRRWAWLACSLIALGVCASRVYLGAHYPTQVLGGAAIGAVTLAVFVRIKDRKWFWQVDLLASLAVTLGFAVVALSSWPHHSMAPDYVPQLAGWTLGALLGLHAETRLFDIVPARRWSRRALAVIVGATAFFLLQRGLKLAGDWLQWPPLWWNGVKGLASGFFVTLPMPWLLARLKLVTVRKAAPGNTAELTAAQAA